MLLGINTVEWGSSICLVCCLETHVVCCEGLSLDSPKQDFPMDFSGNIVSNPLFTSMSSFDDDSDDDRSNNFKPPKEHRRHGPSIQSMCPNPITSENYLIWRSQFEGAL